MFIHTIKKYIGDEVTLFLTTGGAIKGTLQKVELNAAYVIGERNLEPTIVNCDYVISLLPYVIKRDVVKQDDYPYVVKRDDY